MTHKAILELKLRDNPMGSARELVTFVRQSETAMRLQLYENISLIYLFAKCVQADEKQLSLFLADDFWKEPMNARQKPQGKNILRLSMRFHYGASREGALYERCREYAQALKPFFDAGVEYDQLKGKLKAEGGFEGILDRQRASAAPSINADKDIAAEDPHGSDDEGPLEENGSDDDASVDVTARKHPPGKPPSRVSTKEQTERPIFHMRSHLLIDADSQIQKKAFAHLPAAKFLLEVEVGVSDSKFIKLVATGIRAGE